jgi:RimJ/RimL family protein N-acetyltransferase
MDPNVTIRKATNNDAEQLIQHTKIVLQESSQFLGTSPEEYNPTIEEELAWISSRELILVAEVNGSIIGVLDFRLSKSKKFKHKGMFGMSIQESHTNKGIGGALINELLQWAKEAGSIEKISLEVFSNNERAIHLYTKLGFTIEGRLAKNAKLGPDHYVDDIIMSMFIS